VLKNIFTKPDDKMLSILERLPKPVPIDEIKIIAKEDQKKKASDENKKAKEPINWLTVLYTILWVVVGVVVLLFMSPWLVWMWLHAKAKKNQVDEPTKSYNAYRASMYYLNQVGYIYYNTNPKDYAAKIDTALGTNFTMFSGVYQKIKYSKTPLTESELKTVNEFYLPFIKQVKQHFPFKMKLKYFLNINNTWQYISKPKIN